MASHSVTHHLKTIENDIENIIDFELDWEKFSGQRVLVTGASGFLGGYLVRTLLKLNENRILDQPVTVVAMIRDAQQARFKLEDISQNKHLDFIEWDLKQIAVPNIGDCNFIIHCASLASPLHYSIDPVGTFLPNTSGTAALLTAFGQQSSSQKGFLYVSSSEVYGSVPREETLSEDKFGFLDPANLRSCYAESKRAGENLCVSWTAQFGTPTYIVRPFHTYGPGLKETDGRVFADFIFDVVNGEHIRMKSDGSARRAYCYVTDAVRGFFTVLLRGEPAIPYNVANPAGNLSVLELANLLVSLFPEKKLKVVPYSPERKGYIASSFHSLIPDITRILSLGWTPVINPSEGFKRTVESNNLQKAESGNSGRPVNNTSP